jgi:hypothetical protein
MAWRSFVDIFDPPPDFAAGVCAGAGCAGEGFCGCGVQPTTSAMPSNGTGKVDRRADFIALPRIAVKE